MKRALVNNCGLFFTGYNAGVTAELCKLLGPNFFDAHFCSSGSIFGSIFYAANQPSTMLDVWRFYVCGRQLVGLDKLLRGRKVLDLDYLISLFESRKGWLDKDAFANSGVIVKCVMTDYHTGQPVYADLNRFNLWNLARATCAVPYLHGPVKTAFGPMIDGGLSDPFPIQRALDEGYDQVVAVYNKYPSHVCRRREDLACRLSSWFLPSPLRQLVQTFDERVKAAEALFSDPRVKVLRPRWPLEVRTMWDGHRRRLNRTISQGIEDAWCFAPSLTR